MKKILIVIDEIELKYYEFNKLVTNFWLIYEFLRREYIVYICTKTMLFQRNDRAYAYCYSSYLKNLNIFKDDSIKTFMLDDFNIIFFRPDPPVDINYINATYILSYIKNPETFIINSPKAIRENNEKLYINKFQEIVPDNIVTANQNLIREFLFEKNEIILKPTNRCFGSGVFYLNSHDKNINSIIQTITNNGTNIVMVQEYIPEAVNGDKRLIYIFGKIFDYCVRKIPTNNDFKFNEHNENTLKFSELTEKDKYIESIVKDKFQDDGIYLAGLDVINGKVIEINITSPCFFINEINNIFNINFEQMIVNRIEASLEAYLNNCIKI